MRYLACIAALWLFPAQQPAPQVGSALRFAEVRKAANPTVPIHTFCEGEHTTVNVVTPTSDLRAHYHALHEETVYIVRGSGRMRLEDSFISVKEGDIIFLPKRTVHSFSPATDDVVAISIFSPKFDGKDRIFVDR
jgi:quercetin dioxygenase-like cupin family protein